MNRLVVRPTRKLDFKCKNTRTYKFIKVIKERANLAFFILGIIHICIIITQASKVFPTNVRGLFGILEIGFCIFLSYRFGYLGMLLCLITNALAANAMFQMSIKLSSEISPYIGKLPQPLIEGTTSAPGLLFCLGTTRIALIIVSIMVAYTSEQSRKHIKRLEHLINVDGITGVYNHRYFHTKLEEEMTRAKEEAGTLGIIMMDVDNFKKYNDNYGHKAGDSLLYKSAEIFMKEKGDCDIVFRYGGDEFAILLPDIDSKGILIVIENIRKAFYKMTQKEEFYKLSDKVTLSVGYSIFPHLAKNKDELLMQADRALYQAKNMGRNNVQLYRDIFEDIKFFFDSDDQMFGGLRALLGTVSAKDKYTLGHSERVMDYAVMIGKAMDLSGERIRVLKIAALLHDIGKVEIPQNVLNKAEPLTLDDLGILRKHPDYSVDILEPLSGIHLLIDSIRYHHERYDGKGYPSGIKGSEIPLEARILCVADAFDAMLSDRPYRRGMKIEEVIGELKKNKGTQFDPYAVDVFLNCLNIN